MSWLYSRALVEEYLGENSLDGEPSVQLNGNPIQLAYLQQDKMTGFSRLSRFGMTFKPLTEDLGEALLTLYLAAFRAKTSQQQEGGLESTEKNQECGEKWRGSFTKYDQDSCSWKTHQCSLLGDLEPFSETWPRWGLMLDGECWEQQTLEQTIRGTESGLLPDGVTTFHTPNTTGLDGGSNSRKALKKRLEQLPTPTCHNSKEGAFPSEYNRNTPSLATHAGGKLNPTWVEWMMGWPLGWTDLKPLEMDKCLFVQQKHGGF